MTISLGHLAGQHGADGAIDVLDRDSKLHRLLGIERRLGLGDQAMIERLGEAMVLCFALADGGTGEPGLIKNPREVETFSLPVIHALAGVEHVDTTDHVFELAETHLRHELAHFFGDEEEIIHHVLGLAGEALAQLRVLRRHAHRAGVEVTLAHHDAAFHHQWRGREAEFVGAEQCADGHIATGFHLAVGLHRDAPAQIVQHQRLLGLGQTNLPGTASVHQRRQGARAGAAVVAGDGDVIGVRLGDARSHGANTDFSDQLDADGGRRVDVLQVMNKLRQVLNRINIVMRRRRDQTHARHRETQLGNVFTHLISWQLTAFAGLGTLRHFNLNLIGAHQVLGSHTETPRRDLFNARAH